MRDDVFRNLVVAAFISDVRAIASIQDFQFRFFLKLLDMFLGFCFLFLCKSSIASSSVTVIGSIVLGNEAYKPLFWI